MHLLPRILGLDINKNVKNNLNVLFIQELRQYKLQFQINNKPRRPYL